MIANNNYPWLYKDQACLLALNKRLPHTILLSGTKNVGITYLALWYSKTLLCQNINANNGACNTCNNCILFDDRALIDFKHLYLNEDKKSITVEDIRDVIEYINISTHNNKYKIVLIEDVDLLNISSANALLKILEEAPSYAIFILTCTNRDQVIPTILSRCHQYTIKPPNIDELSDYLSTHNISRFWLNFYNNCPILDEVIEDKHKTRLISTLIYPSIDNIFMLTQDFDGKTIPFAIFLDFFNKWLLDLVQFKLTNEIKYFMDYKEKLTPLIDKLNLEKTFYLFDQVNYLIAWSKHPLNYKLQIETILFNYQMIFVKGD